MTVTVYDADTGRIIGLTCGPRSMVLLNETVFVEGNYPADTHYIDLSGTEPEPRTRPVMPVTQDKADVEVNEPVILSNLPVPCRVTIGPAVYEVPDGTLEWSAAMPSAYGIEIEAFPYLNWKGKVTVVESIIHAGT